MKKLVLGFMLLLLIIGVSESTLHLQPIKADPEAQLLLETDEYAYIWWWENVTITLTNISNETVEIKEYPIWTIFTYPKGEPVYPNNFSTVVWQLDPGEKDTFTWNQYNEVNKTYVLPGMYVVMDTQGWGLSAHFELVWCKRYVPQIYPEEVSLAFWMVNETACIKVTITYPVLALKVSDWGTVVRNDSYFGADSEVWKVISDSYYQMVQVLSHTYDLGYLELGNYTFTFSSWGVPVKGVCFTVGLLGDLNYDRRVDMKDIHIVIQAFGSCPDHPRWNPITDVDKDNRVDMKDVYLVITNFRETI